VRSSISLDDNSCWRPHFWILLNFSIYHDIKASLEVKQWL
jgi:hypothetical protein